MEEKIGAVKPGLLADLVNVKGYPSKTVSALRSVQFVKKDGIIYRQESEHSP